ncbi:hypothetical protein BH09VER1_BH09VER1_20630 [soil metagenome]
MVLRLDEGGEVTMVAHSSQIDGCADLATAKRWAGKVVAWFDQGRVGSEPTLMQALDQRVGENTHPQTTPQPTAFGREAAMAGLTL